MGGIFRGNLLDMGPNLGIISVIPLHASEVVYIRRSAKVASSLFRPRRLALLRTAGFFFSC